MSRIDRPYIFCHMMTSLDGKIMGSYIETPQGSVAGDVFYKIAFGQNPFYRHQGWLSGRVTTDDNFTFYKKPTLDLNAALVPAGDFIAQPDFGMFYVSIDPHGKLGWESATLHYGDTTAHVIEVLTAQTSNAYKAFLRKLGISYIVAGEHELDYAVALAKLKYKFHIETLMLGGGGVLNWSFLQAGMCDEVSIVLAAAADADPATPPLFRAKEGLSDSRPLEFTLKEAKAMDGNSLWLRYTVNP